MPIAEMIEKILLLASFASCLSGFAFWLAALKIKSEIHLEITKQLAELSITQARQELSEERQNNRTLVKIRGWIDKNALDIGKIKQEIEQIEQFLVLKHNYHRRPQLPENTLPDDTKL
ncbi:hypothetical protein [Kamptonema sp. UHCC 0994]|uniref:hypothetical protein n=1 Tax=Kamptonema sp. UHCC 0994 TaxID=3031329 RepID=UPI0023BA1786|nr:hypothetical protein [Kamptonema sp. UHCC 0994]MDF0554917.1 hypothetical protein [Kamptonema sp. UHCC 0994]